MASGATFTDFTNPINLNEHGLLIGGPANFSLTLNLDVDALYTNVIANYSTLTRNQGVILAQYWSGGNSTGLAMGKWGTGDLCFEIPNVNYTSITDYVNPSAISGNALTDANVSTTLEGAALNNITTGTLNWSDVDTASITLTNQVGEDACHVSLNVTMDSGDSYVITGGSKSTNRLWSQVGTTNTLYVNSNYVSSVEFIPEPATATLSLLALAGLAARRRRK